MSALRVEGYALLHNQESSMTLLGQPAPDFALPDTDHNTVRLSDQRCKKVFLAFYPAANHGVQPDYAAAKAAL